MSKVLFADPYNIIQYKMNKIILYVGKYYMVKL